MKTCKNVRKAKKKLIAKRKKTTTTIVQVYCMWNGNYLVVLEMIPLKKSPQTTQPPSLTYLVIYLLTYLLTAEAAIA